MFLRLKISDLYSRYLIKLKISCFLTFMTLKTLEISNNTERFIIEALLTAKALKISLIAAVGGE